MGIINFQEVRNGVFLAFFTALFTMSSRSLRIIRKFCRVTLIRQSVLCALFAYTSFGIVQSGYCRDVYPAAYFFQEINIGDSYIDEDMGTKGQDKSVSVISNPNQILPLFISGYNFQDDMKNIMLWKSCGIPLEELYLCKIVMNGFSSNQDLKDEKHETENVKLIADGFQPSPLPLVGYNVSIENKRIPLFMDKAFYRGQYNLMYSKRKAGKSKLAMEVAKSPLIKRPAFILREDYNDGQAGEFRCIVGDKAIVVTMQDWHNAEEKIETQKSSAKFREIILQCTNPEYRKIQNISRSVLAQAGKFAKTIKNPDIAIFHAIVENLINQGVDFICLDSLNALLGGTTNFGRDTIESILDPMRSTGVTFLLIHHKNKNGKMFGSENLPASFDHIYHLELQRKEGREILTLDEEARNTAPTKLTILRTWENSIPIYEMLPETTIPSNPSSLPDKIMEALSSFGEETVLFGDLFEKLDDIKKDRW